MIEFDKLILLQDAYKQFFLKPKHALNVILDQEGIIIDISMTVESWLGFKREDMWNKNFIAFVHPDDVDKTIHNFEDHISAHSENIYFINRWKTKSGEYKELYWDTSQAAKIEDENSLVYGIAYREEIHG